MVAHLREEMFVAVVCFFPTREAVSGVDVSDHRAGIGRTELAVGRVEMRAEMRDTEEYLWDEYRKMGPRKVQRWVQLGSWR